VGCEAQGSSKTRKANPWSPHRKRSLQKEDGRGSAQTVGSREKGSREKKPAKKVTAGKALAKKAKQGSSGAGMMDLLKSVFQ
jgi:hypothetical protein